MKILVVADEEEKGLWEHLERKRLEDIDLILSAGDLRPEYLEFLVTMAHCPLLYVRGNHDDHYDRRPPRGCINIDGLVYEHHGLRIMGLGGCMRYRQGSDMYTEQEMRGRARRMRTQVLAHRGIDLLLTHAPAKGYGDLEDLPHHGFECFNELIERYQPLYMVHGHVHKAYGHFQQEYTHETGTKIVNACGSVELEIPDAELQTEERSRLRSLWIRWNEHRFSDRN